MDCQNLPKCFLWNMQTTPGQDFRIGSLKITGNNQYPYRVYVKEVSLQKSEFPVRR